MRLDAILHAFLPSSTAHPPVGIQKIFAVSCDLGDVVEFVYLLIDLFTIFYTADAETHMFLSIIVVAKITFRYKDYMQRLGFRANPFGDI